MSLAYTADAVLHIIVNRTSTTYPKLPVHGLLVVLIVVIFIFTDRIGKFGEGLESFSTCESNNCKSEIKDCPDTKGKIGKFDNCGNLRVCCVSN